MAETFIYKSLPGPEYIRVLKLHSRRLDSDRLTCSLEPVRLGSTTETFSYFALSYHWGTAPRSRNIECDGISIPVTEHLYRGLQHLQLRSYQNVWVDAICINQSDLEEKSSQVQLMSRIYESAQGVIAWLGDQNDFSRKDSLKRLLVDPGFHLYQNDAALAIVARYNSLLPYLRRSWFTRVWIVQEIMLSNKVTMLLDHEELQWEMFWSRISSEIIQAFGNAGGTPASIQPALRLRVLESTSKSIGFLRKNPLSSWSYSDLNLPRIAAEEFHRILDFSQTLEADDPRDMVYALLGILKPLGIEIPVPNYSKAVELVFQEINIALIKSGYQTPFSYRGSRNNGYEVQKRTRIPGIGATRNTAADSAISCLDLSKWQQYSASLPLTIQTSPVSHKVSPGSEISKLHLAETYCSIEQSLRSDEEADKEPENEGTYQSLFGELLRHHKELLLHHVFEYLRATKFYAGGNNCNSGEDTSHNTSARQEESSAGYEGKDREKQIVEPHEQARGSCRKRLESEDEDEDGPEDRPRKQSKGRTTIDPRDRLACPYFQRNSQGPRLLPSCRSLGFETIARLKEHLYRVYHVHPCQRCGDVFNKQSLLTEHLRSRQVCDTKDWQETIDPARGFDDQQQERLRSRKIQSWNQIFKILFPKDLEGSYPPQYHSNVQLVQLLDNFHDHYTFEIERLVPQQVTDAPFLSTLPPQYHDEIRSAVLIIVTNVHNEVLQSFRRHVLRAAANNRHEIHLMETTSLPNPNAAFLRYLHHVAPEGALASPPVNFGTPDNDWENFFASASYLNVPPDYDVALAPGLEVPNLNSSGAAQYPDSTVSIEGDQAFAEGRNRQNEVALHNSDHPEDTWFVVEDQ